MEDQKPKDVDTYIANATEASRPIMKELREIIKSTVPEAEEEIGWNVPIYKYHGILAGFDTAKNHVSFGVDTIGAQERETLEKEGYKTGNTTIQIKFDQEVPVAVIKQLLKKQAKLNKSKGIDEI